MKRWMICALLLGACSKPSSGPRPPPYVHVTKAIHSSMPIYYEYVGHVEANQAVNIKAQVQGQITKQFFIEGQEVKQGDLLLTIDPRPFLAALEKAQGELTQNLANLKQAIDTKTRYAKLVEQNYISQLDYDQAVTNVFSAEGVVQQGYADVETAKINLDYCTITAPVTGITSKLQIDVGNYVPVGGDPLLSVNQIHPIRVSVYIPEKDLPKIAQLQQQKPLKMVADIPNCPPCEGTLMLIDNQVEENTGTILLQGLFTNEENQLWPGEFVSVKIILEERPNALVIPSQALQVGQNGSFVFVVRDNNIVEIRDVVVAQKEENIAILEKGIEPGDAVVVEGQMNLKSGMQVVIRQ